MPPAGVGDAIACVATSFTFEEEFFETQCLGRFLGLDSQRGEDDPWICLIEEEERLSEVRVTAIVDRGEGPGKRNLRWDLLTAGAPGSLMHAKVAVLAWQRLVRIIVGSANLTPAGYRSQVESCLVLEASPASAVPEIVFTGLLDAVRRLVSSTTGDGNAPGPKRRALQSLSDIGSLVTSFDLPQSPRRTDPLLAVTTSGFGGRPLRALREVWRGGVARSAFILSPFFDEDPSGNLTADALVDELAQRGPCQVTFVLPVNVGADRLAVRAPKSLSSALPPRIDASFEAFMPTGEEEPRRLHAKAVVLESDSWVAGLVGSSNFTAKGMGLSPRSHFEVGVAIGAPLASATGDAISALIPPGEPLDVSDVVWEPQDDEDEADRPILPWGFVECLLDPGPPSTVVVRFAPNELPAYWSIRLPSGRSLLDQASWRRGGSPVESRIDLGCERAFFLEVRWGDDSEGQITTWPLNVTEPTKLPPPDELRLLPVEALLSALASTRPVHEAVAEAIRQEEHRQNKRSLPAELDPLRRYSSTGQLLKRARRVSEALAGLQRRLERPAANLEALEWRLRGPFGPIAVAQKLLDEDATAGMVSGEPAFLLAELALTLSRVDWDRTATVVPRAEIDARVREVLDELRSLRESIHVDAWLAAYVDRAFVEADH
jgi:hypothetical protein